MTSRNHHLFRQGLDHCANLVDEANRLARRPDTARDLDSLSEIARNLSTCLARVAVEVNTQAIHARQRDAVPLLRSRSGGSHRAVLTAGVAASGHAEC